MSIGNLFANRWKNWIPSSAAGSDDFLKTVSRPSMILAKVPSDFTGPNWATTGATGGHFRIICDIQAQRLVVLVIEIDHRSGIYR